MTRLLVRTIMVAAATLPPAACRQEAPPPETAVVTEPTALAAPGDTVYAPRPEQVAELPDRIYFTLTDHAWYARGEPLLHGNMAFHPTGMPIPAALAQMHHAGEYEGVDYYVRDGDDGHVVYVPVFEGYWQAFRPDTSRATR